MSVNNQNTVARYRTIDGLRGIAAMAVVLFHLSGKLQAELEGALPAWINLVMSYGYLGVPVFFVISGFVIALSIKDARIDARYAGNFALRRSIRLDLTYWASMVAILMLMVINNQFLGGSTAYPSFSDILLHMFYLQDLAGVDPVISVVYWTLCLEVQLYLFFLLSVWLSQATARHTQLSARGLLLGGLLLLGVYSVMLEQNMTSLSFSGLFLPYWHYFLIGVLLSHAVQGKPGGTAMLLVWLTIESGFLLAGEIKSYPVAGIIIGGLLFALWRWYSLDKLLSSRAMQYLGALSYTLYLVHPDFGWKTIALGQKLFGPEMSSAEALLVFSGAILTALVAAHCFHVLFEKPSLKLAKALKSQSLGQLLSGYMKNRLSLATAAR